MSLTPHSAWPPPAHARVLERVADCQTWWEGTSSRLTSHYGGQGSAGPMTRAGGDSLASVFREWRHGSPVVESGQQRVHIPLAADLAQTSAALLFADPPAMSVDADGTEPIGNEAAALRLDRMTNTAGAHASLLVAAETSAALGGIYPRVVWDKAVSGTAWLDWVDPDRALPEWRWGRLVAVTFYSEHPNGADVWRHTERYEAGRIVHTLWCGERNNLGRVMPLGEHPATAGLVDVVDAESAVDTGTDLLAAGYVPNARPNPEWRTHPELRHLGRPDISRDVVPLMAQVDEAFTSLMRDVRLARARLVASDSLLDSKGPGRGSSFDTDREVFARVADAPGSDGSMTALLEAHQFAIRVEEHTATADALTREVLRRVGYSPMTFGMLDPAAAGAATATEINARLVASNATRKAKSRLYKAALGPLLRALLEVDAAQFGTGAQVGDDVDVDWSESVQDSPLVRAQTVQALDTARAVTTETKVAMLHPDWDTQRRDDEVAGILAEQGIMVPDPAAFGESQYPDPSVGQE